MRISFLTLLIVMIVSCKTTSNAQKSIEKPFEDILWLKELKEGFDKDSSIKKAMIIQYEYKNEIVYLVENCYQCPDGMSTVYNSKKEKVCEFGGIMGMSTCPDFSEKASKEKVIYKNFK